MIKLQFLIFLFLFCIFHKFKNLNAAKKEPEISLCLTPECINAASIIRQSMDPKVAPCDDFNKFVCGNFLRTSVIPKNKIRVDRYDITNDKMQKQLKIGIEEAIQPKEPRSITLAKHFYKACMDTTSIEKNGLRAVLDDFKKLGGWPVLEGDLWKDKKFDWKQSTYDMQKLGYGTNYLFTFKVVTDFRNNKKHVLNIDQTSLFIDRNYLVKGFNNTIVTEYHNYMVDIAVIFGANRARAEKELKESLNFEIKLANISISEEDRRNMTALSNPMTVKELTKKYPSIPWKEYFNSILKSIIEIGDDEVIIVSVPTFFKKFETLIKETPKRVLANYLLWRGAQEDLNYLTEKIRNRQLRFTTLLNGETEKQARWSECLDATMGILGLSVGALYARKYFNQESKKSAEKLAVDIENQLKKILEKVDWMDEQTRRSALDKLESMKNFIGYPDELFDDKTLDEFYKKVEITPNDYFKASTNMSLFWANHFFSDLRKPVNASEWTNHGETAVVNAAYSVQGNGIEIPAGILQGIFYNKDRPQYLNYAGIGSFVMGHEITHAFDILGSQFDKNGNLKDWWTPETKKKFLEKAHCIVQQYGNYTAEEVGLKLNGVLTQGENIADNGGVKISYLAYQDWVKRNGPEPKLPGLNYSPSQLFWIHAAIQQCAKYTPEFLKNIITTNVHSPSGFRIIGPFSNRPEFARDFNCPLGSKMNPVKKCSVW